MNDNELLKSAEMAGKTDEEQYEAPVIQPWLETDDGIRNIQNQFNDLDGDSILEQIRARRLDARLTKIEDNIRTLRNYIVGRFGLEDQIDFVKKGATLIADVKAIRAEQKKKLIEIFDDE